MIRRSQPKTKSSRTLLRVVVSEIGLQWDSADMGVDILAIGTTSAQSWYRSLVDRCVENGSYWTADHGGAFLE